MDLHDVAEDHLHEGDLPDDVGGDLQDFVVGFLETVWTHHVLVGDPRGRIGVKNFVADLEAPQASLEETLVVFVVGT